MLVMGLGGLGIHAIQIARALGANVIGADIDPAKLKIAKQLGFDRLAQFEPGEDFVESVRTLAAGNSVSVIMETVSIPATIDADLKLLGRAGRLILAGYTNTPVSVPPYALVLNVSIYGSRASSREDVRAVISMFEKGNIKSMVSKTYPLAEVNCAIEDLKLGQSYWTAGHCRRVALA